MTLSQAVQGLVQASIKEALAQEADAYYLTNRIYHLLGVTPQDPDPLDQVGDFLPALLGLVDLACQEGLIPDQSWTRDVLEQELANLWMPMPSALNATFQAAYQESPQAATDWFYGLSKSLNLVKLQAIAKNQELVGDSDYGPLQITINLSKPEKTQEEIIAAAKAAKGHYPADPLAYENTGYTGRIDWPARANHRIIDWDLNGQAWGYHYSPYAYYPEHCIFLSRDREPMKVDGAAYGRLLKIIQDFPHYFVGSNAGLPIVGGSILSHNHYQGGRHDFPMNHAKVILEGTAKSYPQVTVQAIHWPMSVVRLRSKDPQALQDMAVQVQASWEGYNNPACDIVSHTGDQAHQAITPIVRHEGEDIVMDLVLRNNRTSAEYPMGIFHPHPQLHHIKQENIGLIEVMGLAILPGRLATELQAVQAYLDDQGDLDQVLDIHQDWAQKLKQEGSHDLGQALAQVFQAVLEDAGVFKQDAQGQAAYLSFVQGFLQED